MGFTRIQRSEFQCVGGSVGGDPNYAIDYALGGSAFAEKLQVAIANDVIAGQGVGDSIHLRIWTTGGIIERDVPYGETDSYSGQIYRVQVGADPNVYIEFLLDVPPVSVQLQTIVLGSSPATFSMIIVGYGLLDTPYGEPNTSPFPVVSGQINEVLVVNLGGSPGFGGPCVTRVTGILVFLEFVSGSATSFALSNVTLGLSPVFNTGSLPGGIRPTLAVDPGPYTFKPTETYAFALLPIAQPSSSAYAGSQVPTHPAPTQQLPRDFFDGQDELILFLTAGAFTGTANIKAHVAIMGYTEPS